jgi:glutaredoxin
VRHPGTPAADPQGPQVSPSPGRNTVDNRWRLGLSLLHHMLDQFKERLRAFAHRQLEGGSKTEHPMARHARNLAGIVNELAGRPIRGADELADGPQTRKTEVVTSPAAPVVAAPVAVQAPVVLYFDGKDHRTKSKVEELLRSRQIAFQVLDVTDDEAERSWVTTTAKQTEFPIVVIAGTPAGGLAELTQLDLEGELKRRVFGLH